MSSPMREAGWPWAMVSSYPAWRNDGKGITMAIYESQAAAETAGPQVQANCGGMADQLIAAPQVETYENVEKLSD